jgi:hypothetical protein
MDRFFFFNFEYNSAFIVAITEVSSSESLNKRFQTITQSYIEKADKAMASSLAMVSALVFNSWPFYHV